MTFKWHRPLKNTSLVRYDTIWYIYVRSKADAWPA